MVLVRTPDRRQNPVSETRGLKNEQDCVLDKDKMTDIVQKHNIFTPGIVRIVEF
jgi:hypothetical protein